MDKATYEEPAVLESFDDREIFGDAPALTASAGMPPGSLTIT